MYFVIQVSKTKTKAKEGYLLKNEMHRNESNETGISEITAINSSQQIPPIRKCLVTQWGVERKLTSFSVNYRNRDFQYVLIPMLTAS